VELTDGKSNKGRVSTMLDHQEYTIDGNGYQGNGYDKLDGDYALFYKVAKGFKHRVRREDGEDFLHDLFVSFAGVKTKYDQIGKPLTEGGLIRVACYEVAGYWRKWYHRHKNTDCGRCSNRQRLKCKEDKSYGGKCPKAIQIESLDRLVEDGNGDCTPLYELIADDNAVDLVARLDARLILDGYPRRFVQIAYKKYAGYPLTDNERACLYRHRKKAQKSLL
jgi:hypothetical protein